MRIFLFIAFAALVVYLSGCIMGGSFDVGQWHWFARAFVGLIALAAGLIGVVIVVIVVIVAIATSKD